MKCLWNAAGGILCPLMPDPLAEHQTSPVSVITHWATWRHIPSCATGLPTSLAFRWDCAGRGRKKKNVCRLGHRSEMIFVCFNLTMFLQQLPLSRQINSLVFFCSVCDGVLHEDLVFQSVQWKPDVAWDGWSVSPAVSMRCVLPVLLLNLVATSPVPPPTRQANGCHGCARICMGMWGVSIVRICVEIKVVVPYSTRLPGSYAEAWEYVVAGGMSVFTCISNKKIPTWNYWSIWYHCKLPAWHAFLLSCWQISSSLVLWLAATKFARK